MWNFLSNDIVGCKNSHFLLQNIDYTNFFKERAAI